MFWVFVEAGQVGAGRIRIAGPQGHHLARVLRVRPGEQGVAVADGTEYRLEVTEVEGSVVTGRVIEERPPQMEPFVEVLGQRLDPHRLSGVVAGVKHVQLQLLGVDWYMGQEATYSAVRRTAMLRDPSAFPILMAHHPHAFNAAAEAGLPLTLSGHTHGGQLMLNEQLGFGPALFRYWSGLYRRGQSKLIVSNGVGNWFPLRVNAPAEIVHLTLRRE